MRDTLVMSAGVAINDGCEMRASVQNSDTTCFILGGREEPLDIMFDAESLRCFIGLAQRGLAEMDKRQADEAAGQPELDKPLRLDVEGASCPRE